MSAWGAFMPGNTTQPTISVGLSPQVQTASSPAVSGSAMEAGPSNSTGVSSACRPPRPRSQMSSDSSWTPIEAINPGNMPQQVESMMMSWMDEYMNE